MAVQDNIQEFVKVFFAASDNSPHTNPASHDEYVNFYKPDATLFMGKNIFNGRDEIRSWRVGGWNNIQKREHIVNGVVIGQDGETMLHGIVKYTKSGDTEPGPPIHFAAHMVFEDPKAKDLKLKFYQVYLTLP